MSTSMLAGLAVRNTRNNITADTKINHLVIADGKRGKTTLAASLNELTLRLHGRPSLFVAVEAGDGGGTDSIDGFGIDYVCPRNQSEFDAIVSTLATDKTYAGVVLDSATEAVNRIIKPYALTFPSRERSQVRTMGVPERGDYQSMGEFMRQRLNSLINLTSAEYMAPELRKHLIVTARLREKYNDDGVVTSRGPDLPGAMAANAVGMFQTVSRIDMRTVTVRGADGKPQRIEQRTLVTRPDPVSALGDRRKVLPEELVLTNPDGSYVGYPQIWEQYWVPRIEAAAAAN